MGFPKIETIQYFLVRNIETELTQSHADFHKMRRLEPILWNKYLHELGTTSPENWIIYQWKKGGNASADVEDFIALAFFQRPRYHMALYVFGILFLGAAGGSLQSILTFTYRYFKFPSGEDSFWTQILVIVTLAVLLIILFASSRWKRDGGERVS